MKYKDFNGTVNELVLLKVKEIEEREHIKVLHVWNPAAEHGALPLRTAIMMYGLSMYGTKIFICLSGKRKIILTGN